MSSSTSHGNHAGQAHDAVAHQTALMAAISVVPIKNSEVLQSGLVEQAFQNPMLLNF